MKRKLTRLGSCFMTFKLCWCHPVDFARRAGAELDVGVKYHSLN